jgi:hypothetical protein
MGVLRLKENTSTHICHAPAASKFYVTDAVSRAQTARGEPSSLVKRATWNVVEMHEKY